MTTDSQRPWSQVTDDALVERLARAVQRACADEVRGARCAEEWVELPAPEAMAALLHVAATLLEQAPQCRTPAGMRRVSEAAGKELLGLMRGYREQAQTTGGGAVH